MMRGWCQGCGETVVIDVPPDGHTRPEHACRGDERECYRRCPVAVLCGPVEQEPAEEEAGG